MELICRSRSVRMRGTEDDRRIIRTILSHPDPHPNRDPRYSAGTWDGVHRFYTRDGRCFLRGLLEMVVDRLEDEEIEYSLQEPQRPVKTWDIPEDFLRGIKLRDYQREAVERSLEHRRGILRIPPRGGKTECQIAVAQALNKPSLLLVNKQKLLRQHYTRFRKRGLRDVGRVGAGLRETDHRHLIGMTQTLARALDGVDPWARDLLASRVLVQSDECHHAGSAAGWRALLEACTGARWMLGWSGTPLRDHGHRGDFHASDVWLQGLTGPLIYEINSSYLQAHGWLAVPELRVLPVGGRVYAKNFPAAYREGIVQHIRRNRMVVALGANLARQGHRTLILITQIKHGQTLLKELDDQGIEAALSVGSDRVCHYRKGGFRWTKGEEAVKEATRAFRRRQRPVLIGSTVYQEGIDLPWLDALVNAGGWRSPIVTLQRTYRAMTRDSSGGENKALIFDFMDEHHYLLNNHSEERLVSYEWEEIPYTVGSSPLTRLR